MSHDIEGANNAGANFPVALGLSDYTEILGGLVTGNQKVQGNAEKNYEAFLPYMGQYYVDLDNKIDLYDRVRCGLSHEYFIKGEAVIARALSDPEGNTEQIPGIVHIETPNQATIMTDTGARTLPVDSVVFGTRNYSRDFTKAYEKYHSDLIAEFSVPESQRELLPIFERAI